MKWKKTLLIGLVLFLINIVPALAQVSLSLPLIDAYRTDGNKMTILFSYDKNILSVDASQALFMKNATIYLPREKRVGVSIRPKIMSRDNDKEPFSYENIELNVNDQYYYFTVDHFSDWYVNSSGGNYTSLTDCMFAINNTNNTCNINEAGFYDINNTYDFYVKDDAIEIWTSNVTMDCNGSWIRGDGQGSDQGIRSYRTGDNLTFLNCNLQRFGRNYELDLLTFNRGIIINNSISELGRCVYLNNADNSQVNNITCNDQDDTYATTLSNSDNLKINKLHLLNCTASIFCFFGASTNTHINDLIVNVTGNADCGHWNEHQLNITDSEWNCNGNDGIELLGTGLNISNSYIRHGTFGIDYKTHGQSRIINNTFYNLTEEGINLSSWGNTIVNNTFTNVGDSQTNHNYYIDRNSRTYGGTDYTYTDGSGSGLIIQEGVIDVLNIEADGTDASDFFNGTQNGTLCLFTVAGALPVTIISTNTDNCTSINISLNAVYPNTVLDYAEEDVYVNQGFNNNYTMAFSGTTTTTTGYSNERLWHLETHEQTQYSINVKGTQNNITGNTFYNSTNGIGLIYSIRMMGTSATVILNNFYYGIVHDTSPDTLYCNNNLGNFYEESLTPMTGDCGQGNFTYPTGGAFSFNVNNTMIVTWTSQSSLFNVSYDVFYSLDFSTWTSICTTSNLNCSWDYSGLFTGNLTEENISVKIIPTQEGYNGTNGIVSYFSVGFWDSSDLWLSGALLLLGIIAVFGYYAVKIDIGLLWLKNLFFGSAMLFSFIAVNFARLVMIEESASQTMVNLLLRYFNAITITMYIVFLLLMVSFFIYTMQMFGGLHGKKQNEKMFNRF